MIRLFTDPTPAGGLVLCTLLVLACGAGVALASDRDADPTEADPPTLTTDELAAGIAWFVAAAPRGHPLALDTAKARRRAEQIRSVAATYGVPNSLVLAIAIRESGIRVSAVDAVGARGLMQVSPCNVRKLGCEMERAAGQLHCGCRVLRMGFDKCGTWRGALTYYGSRDERCAAERGTRLVWMATDRLRLAERIREGSR